MADRDAMIEDATRALNTPSGLVKLPALDVLEVLTRESHLAKGLVQIMNSDYPPEVVDAAGGRPMAERWALQVLVDPTCVLGDDQ